MAGLRSALGLPGLRVVESRFGSEFVVIEIQVEERARVVEALLQLQYESGHLQVSTTRHDWRI